MHNSTPHQRILARARSIQPNLLQQTDDQTNTRIFYTNIGYVTTVYRWAWKWQTFISRMPLPDISGSHSNIFEYLKVLGCETVSTGKQTPARYSSRTA